MQESKQQEATASLQKGHVIVMDIYFSKDKHKLVVFRNEAEVGEIQFYKNTFHQTNTYLRLDLDSLSYEEAVLALLACREKCDTPLQVMLDPGLEQYKKILLKAGFRLARHCIIADFSQEDLACPLIPSVELASTTTKDRDWLIFSKALFTYYCKNHAGINPWTGSFEEFCGVLTETILYDKDLPLNFAFIEDNEIAYCHGTDVDGFQSFGQSLVSWMFNKYERICFEADDNDPYALILLGLFRPKVLEYCDTYILPQT